MLENVTIVKNRQNLGELAEAIVYYGHVDCVINSGGVIALIRELGIDGAIRLASSPVVSIQYNRSYPILRTNYGRLYPHSFGFMRHSGTVGGTPIDSPHHEIFEAVRSRIGHGVIPRRKIEAFCNLLEVREAPSSQIGLATLEDLKDARFLESGVNSVISALVPEYGKVDGSKHEIVVQDGSFQAFFGIDFERANTFYSKRVPESDSKITTEFVLSHFLSMRFEMFYSGGNGADLWTDDVNSALLCNLVNSFADRIGKNRDSIDRFQRVLFPIRNFKSSVETGERGFLDVLEFVESSDTMEFKKWIASSSTNADILREYDKAKVQPSALARSLPIKYARSIVFAGLGVAIDVALGGVGLTGPIVGAAADVALGAADEALLSRLKVGWKPNQWVSNSALPFLERRSQFG